MIYGTEITKTFKPKKATIDRVLRLLGKDKPKVFLFSGGGNDVAGEEFASFLNHKHSHLAALRHDYVRYMIHTVFKKYYKDLIAKVKAVSPGTHIVTHGYGRTVPTGKGVKKFFKTWAGPWLRPRLAEKRILDAAEQRRIAFKMIDEFNKMLKGVDKENAKFTHGIDLRTELDPDKDWANELHLKNAAFARVASIFHDTIQTL